MKEIKIYVIGVVLGVVLGILFSLLFILKDAEHKGIAIPIVTEVVNTKTVQADPITINNTVYVNDTHYVFRSTQYELINIINRNAEAHNYERGVYDCINFTKQTYSDLDDAGYFVDKYTTYIQDRQKYHAFIGVYIYIEPTTGEIIEPKDYYNFGITSHKLRQYDYSSNEYSDQNAVDTDYIKVCSRNN